MLAVGFESRSGLCDGCFNRRYDKCLIVNSETDATLYETRVKLIRDGSEPMLTMWQMDFNH